MFSTDTSLLCGGVHSFFETTLTNCKESNVCLPFTPYFFINNENIKIYVNDILYPIDNDYINNICDPESLSEMCEFYTGLNNSNSFSLISTTKTLNGNTIIKAHNFTFSTAQQLADYLNNDNDISIGVWGVESIYGIGNNMLIVSNVNNSNNIVELNITDNSTGIASIYTFKLLNNLKLKLPEICDNKISIKNEYTKDGLPVEDLLRQYIFKCTNCYGNCHGEELITNGNFENGVAGWNTDLTEYTGGAQAGTYQILQHSSLDCPISSHPVADNCFHQFPSPSTLRTLYKTINVEPNKNYLFSTLIYDNIIAPVFLNLKLNGANSLLSPEIFQNCTNGTGSWNKYSMIWNSGNNTSLTFEILPYTTVENNDFIIDDISIKEIKPCPEICHGQDILANGNFENNLNNWGTDLFPLDASCNGCNGWYTFGTTSWCSTPDHSENGSIMLTSSPSDDISKRLLYQTVPVQPNSTYQFSGWVMNYSPNPPILKVVINGNELLAYPVSNLSCSDWMNYTATYNTGQNTTANIALYDLQTFIYGNDFALDDLSFKQIIPCNSNTCITTDNLACSNLYFSENSTKVCVPIIVNGNITNANSNPLHFCLQFDNAHLLPVRFIQESTVTGTVTTDLSTPGSVCFDMLLNNIQQNPQDKLTIGCFEFNVDELSYPLGTTVNTTTNSFTIPDGCKDLLDKLKAWLTESQMYWETENGQFWEFER